MTEILLPRSVAILFFRRIGARFFKVRFSNSFGTRFYTTGIKNDINTANQLVPSENDQQLSLLFNQFPVNEIRYAFGYGSGVFQQAGYDKLRPQIDMIHIVDDPLRFHILNTERNRSHYSGLLCLGINAVLAVQNYGAGVYFNPYVALKDQEGNENMVKYGVVSTETALKDIQEWSTLYIAGRLQKPVKYLHGDETLRMANDHNLRSAFNLALLLLSRSKESELVTHTRIYEKVALLSYMGDPRMAVGGENPNKVRNIVSKQKEKFDFLYHPYLEESMQKGYLVRLGDKYEVRLNVDSVSQILATLPFQFRKKLLNSYRNKYKLQLLQDDSAEQVLLGNNIEMAVGPYLREILMDRGLKRTLMASLLATVAYPALIQSLKGIFSAGIVKSTKYALDKKRKSWEKVARE